MSCIVCINSYVPIRSEASHRSEMVSQLLFGETAKIEKTQKEWIKVITHFDGYAGWIESDSVSKCPESYPGTEKVIISQPFIHLKGDKGLIWIPGGSELPLPEKLAEQSSIIAEKKFKTESYGFKKPTAIIDTAKQFLNAPYLWGGRTAFGIDCSGFVQIVFKIHGHVLLRDASDQAKSGTLVKDLFEAKPNDLFFFKNETEKITHVGIYLGEGLIIHASKLVRIDRVNDQGIIYSDSDRYSHNLHSIRRIIH